MNIPAGPGAPLLVNGHGAVYFDGPGTDILMEATTLSVSSSECLETNPNHDPSIHICATTPLGGAAPCRGDGGGPVFFEEKGEIVGIVSYGSLICSEPGEGSVYARVAAFGGFIQQVLTTEPSLICRDQTTCDAQFAPNPFDVSGAEPEPISPPPGPTPPSPTPTAPTPDTCSSRSLFGKFK